MSSLCSVDDLINLWPSMGEFAQAIAASYGAVKQMRRRGSIGVTYWPAIIASDVGRQHQLTADILVSLHASRSIEAA